MSYHVVYLKMFHVHLKIMCVLLLWDEKIYIWVRVQHGPTLLTSLGVTQLTNFFDNDLPSVHSPSGYTLPLCFSHLVSIPPSDFKHPGPSQCQAALLAVVGKGAVDLTLL